MSPATQEQYESLPAADRQQVRIDAEARATGAGFQFAQLCIRELAIEIRSVFPGAASAIVDMDYDGDAALWRVYSQDGAALWDRETDRCPGHWPMGTLAHCMPCNVAFRFIDAHTYHRDLCGTVLDQDDDRHGEPNEDAYRHVITLPEAEDHTTALTHGQVPA